MIMKFGKYRGYDIRSVPADYLEWAIEHNRSTIKSYQEELDRRQSLEEASMGMIERIIKAGYRDLAKKFHPDNGGSTEQMQELNGSYERLKAAYEGR